MLVTAAIFTLPSFKVLVDRVRGGVIPSWLPRRLGGGLGQRQKGTQRFTWKVYIPVTLLFFLLTSLFAERLEKATCPTWKMK